MEDSGDQNPNYKTWMLTTTPAKALNSKALMETSRSTAPGSPGSQWPRAMTFGASVVGFTDRVQHGAAAPVRDVSSSVPGK